MALGNKKYHPITTNNFDSHPIQIYGTFTLRFTTTSATFTFLLPFLNYTLFTISLFTTLLLCYTLVSPTTAFSQIVINEFQPAPIGEENEWIELYNFSEEYVKTDSLIIKDNKTSKFLGKFVFPPQSYTIITKDTSVLKEQYSLITGQQKILVEAKFPALNNTTDEIRIYSGKVLLDSLFYNVKWGVKGSSFERTDPKQAANSNENLLPSVSRRSATPLEINSHIKVNFDLDTKKIYYDKENYNLVIEVYNNGLSSIANSTFTLKLLNVNTNITLLTDNIPSLSPDSTFTIKHNISEFVQGSEIGGKLEFTAFVNNILDVRKTNNTNSFTYFIPYPNNSLVINEFLSDAGINAENNRQMGEFLEIYNTSTLTINLLNFSIDDAATYESNTGIIINKDLIIKPDEYAVICWDTTLFSTFPELKSSPQVYYTHKPSFNLNIKSDFVVLRDEHLNTLDSIAYLSQWHSPLFKKTRNISLERINSNGETNESSNWSSCLEEIGATPLNKNSISGIVIDQNNSATVTPNPFSPSRSGVQTSCLISYSFSVESVNLTITIFDLYGNNRKNLIKDKALPSTYSVLWDGTDESGQILPVGAYVILIEAVDTYTNKVFLLKKLIAIG